MVDLLPPVASQSREEDWRRALTMSLPMTPDMVNARFMQIGRYQPVVFLPRIEVPHPSHRDYSMIETMKRDAVEKQKDMNRTVVIMRGSTLPNYSTWTPPQFRAGIPRMKDFRKPMRLELPNLLR